MKTSRRASESRGGTRAHDVHAAAQQQRVVRDQRGERASASASASGHAQRAREHVRQQREHQQHRDPARRDARHALGLRRANARQDARDDVVGARSVELGFGAHDDAVREHERRDVFHVVGRRERAAVEKRRGLCGDDERERGARARAERDVGRVRVAAMTSYR